MAARAAAAAAPEVRNLRFDLGPEVPRHWHGGRKAVSRFFDGLSIFFPLGERFFVQAVKAHREWADSDALREAVAAFCAQEGIHSREHARYNDMLRERGYPIDRLEGRVAKILGRATRRLPKREHLAATCALEHFTAVLAHVLLSRPELLDGADLEMARLWRWHAAEETEHRSVAFDVYQRAGGGYAERCAVMGVTAVTFWARVMMHQVALMRADGIALSAREWASLMRFLWVRPGGMLQVVRMSLEYFRPGFHPSQLDSDGLLAAWRAAEG